MRAVVYAGESRVEVDTVPDPGVEEPTDAVVRVRRAAVCGTDLHVVAHPTGLPETSGTNLRKLLFCLSAKMGQCTKVKRLRDALTFQPSEPLNLRQVFLRVTCVLRLNLHLLASSAFNFETCERRMNRD